MEFEGLHFQFEETQGGVTLSLLRRGNLDTTIVVNCVLKSHTASEEDFIMLGRPQMVEFQPGRNTSGKLPPGPIAVCTTHCGIAVSQVYSSRAPMFSNIGFSTTVACHVFILDDDIWEREESFSVRLTSSDQNVVISHTHSNATVVITDLEDGELFFSSPNP